MKKIVSLCLAAVLCCLLCGCSVSYSSIQSNLKSADYTVIEMDEEKLNGLNTELTYSYGGSGSIVKGFYGVNNKTGEGVTVLEFNNKSDLTLMYKMAESSIEEEREAVDLSGHILVFGEKAGVKAALK